VAGEGGAGAGGRFDGHGSAGENCNNSGRSGSSGGGAINSGKELQVGPIKTLVESDYGFSALE
jgi:hypothetical protein